MRVQSKLLMGSVLFAMSISASFAGVNVNNGNFYVAYTDMFLPTAGLSIDLTRTYNSRSNYIKGHFGVGWSSEVEGYLRVEANSISYFEGGGGNVIKFTKGKGAGEWDNGIFGPQTIRKTANGYALRAINGKEFLFGSDGRIQKISDKNKNFLEVVYVGGRMSMLKDNLNNQIQVKWQDFGGSPRIVSLDAGRFKARFEYEKFGDLVKSIGFDGIPYAYSYDDEHNMTKISYKDGTYKEMGYNKTRDWITKFRDKDKLVTTYDYTSDSVDPENKFGTVVVRYQEGSKDRDVSRYWYEFRKRADGTRFNYKSISWIMNKVTETIFTECCGTPQAISQWTAKGDAAKEVGTAWTVAKSGKQTTFFEYNTAGPLSGLLKKKTSSDGSVTALTYNTKFRKVETVNRNGRKIQYSYDALGNLASAYDSAENKKLGLTYNRNGLLVAINEKSFLGNKPQVRDVFFDYNTEGRPTRIKEKSPINGEGIIRISYDKASGAVTGLFNDKNKPFTEEKDIQTARRVASTFQNLLEIVQPAGVTLTPEG